MIGSQINQYKIQEKIGSGGQGTVYKALDTKLNRTVVIKVLPPELTAKTANFKRFEREAQLCSQLDHPNICTIYDFHEANGIYYIAMQYVKGKNVRLHWRPARPLFCPQRGDRVHSHRSPYGNRARQHRDTPPGRRVGQPCPRVERLNPVPPSCPRSRHIE